MAVYKDGPLFELVAIDHAGKIRPDWAAALRQRPLLAQPVSREADERIDWPHLIRRLRTRLDMARRPHALAAIVVRPLPN